MDDARSSQCGPVKPGSQTHPGCLQVPANKKEPRKKENNNNNNGGGCVRDKSRFAKRDGAHVGLECVCVNVRFIGCHTFFARSTVDAKRQGSRFHRRNGIFSANVIDGMFAVIARISGWHCARRVHIDAIARSFVLIVADAFASIQTQMFTVTAHLDLFFAIHTVIAVGTNTMLEIVVTRVIHIRSILFQIGKHTDILHSNATRATVLTFQITIGFICIVVYDIPVHGSNGG